MRDPRLRAEGVSHKTHDSASHNLPALFPLRKRGTRACGGSASQECVQSSGGKKQTMEQGAPFPDHPLGWTSCPSAGSTNSRLLTGWPRLQRAASPELHLSSDIHIRALRRRGPK